jgi:hypothetical protein
LPNEIDYAATREWFTTSDSHFRYTKLGGDANEPKDFFVRQDFVAWQPLLQFLRHTIIAPLVTTVRDGDTEIGNPMAVTILHPPRRYEEHGG